MSEYVRPEYTPLFREVQETIAGYLNADTQISAKHIEFFPEAKLDIDFEVKKALGQQGIVGVVNTLKGTFAGHDGCTNAWQIEAEVDVIENPPVRRAQLKKMGLSTGTVSDILDWIQESLGGPSSPTFAKFNPVSQEIGQNQGLVVGRSIMRTLVLADTSAVISTENQWVCPYALRQELSALYDQIGELSSELSSIPQTVDVQLSSSWHLSPWDGDRKMVQELVFSPDGGMIETPSGDFWACDRLELTKDGQATELILTLNKQYNVDGEGNLTVLGPGPSFNPNPYIVEVGNKTLELWFKVDGAGVYGVQVDDPQEQTIVAQQPDHQQYFFCDLEFDYNGSHFTIKAKNNYRLFIPSSEFIRDSMASNPGMDFYNLMSQMYLPLSGGQMSGDITVGKDNQIVFGSNSDGTVVFKDPSEADFGIYLSAEEDGEIAYQSKYIFRDTYNSGFNVVEPFEEDAAVIRSGDLYAALSSKADARSLSNYLPLSGGQVNGNLSVGTGVQLFNEADGGVVKISDGSSNQTFYQHNKIGTPNGNLYFPSSIPTEDETIATQEYVNGIVGDIETILEAL